MVEKYKVKVLCFNCNFEGFLEIPRGKAIKEIKCPNCFCKTLRTIDKFDKIFHDMEEKFDSLSSKKPR